MARLSLSSLGTLVREERGGRGIRNVASEIGISSATLSRIENGKVPDLDTFTKICKWLEIDPSEVLGCKENARKKENARRSEGQSEQGLVFAHLKADRNLEEETIQSLAEMILRARRMMAERLTQNP